MALFLFDPDFRNDRKAHRLGGGNRRKLVLGSASPDELVDLDPAKLPHVETVQPKSGGISWGADFDPLNPEKSR